MGAVSSRRMSPDGQRKPLAERAASPSQCAHLAERRGEGRELLHFWGRYQPPRPSPAPRTPPPPHPRPPGPASSAAARDPPPPPAPGSASPALPALPLTCPALARRPPAASPFPTEKQKSPAEEVDRQLSTGSERDFPPRTPFFFFSLPPKRVAPLEAGGGLGSGPCPGDSAERGHPRTRSEGSALFNDSRDQGAPKPAGQGAQLPVGARIRVASHRHRTGTARPRGAPAPGRCSVQSSRYPPANSEVLLSLNKVPIFSASVQALMFVYEFVMKEDVKELCFWRLQGASGKKERKCIQTSVCAPGKAGGAAGWTDGRTDGRTDGGSRDTPGLSLTPN
ncbi:WAS/WASL-interacting protein family member 3-like [Corvus cornix cornix]|uniref:WAS/WASL-interacting protein family member 3-like n=1 Tax=Corvus cornix cornix TaxID=932674 RepID=UPI001950EFD7|nr:WAS/WASL-interacting protein family member 3-like [Corvus cornix cornix]